MKSKFLVILGPTATGKSDLAVALALEIAENKIGGYEDAEIISADSRQVYRGLDIGTGKITREEMRGIPHRLIDIADPNERFTVADWKKLAQECIADADKHGRLAIICGGTGYYISALIDDLRFPEAETDPDEQKALESKPTHDLYDELKRLDPARASSMAHDGESMNKRRLARSILIARALGSVPEMQDPATLLSDQTVPNPGLYDPLLIGLAMPDAELKQRIRDRLIRRLYAGMIEEARRLHEPPPTGAGLSFERMDELGLEYRYLAKYLKGELDRDQLIETLSTKIWQFARRQKTWWKRDGRIEWFDPDSRDEIYSRVHAWLHEIA